MHITSSRFFLLMLVLCGCASPSIDMQGSQKVEFSENGLTYTLFHEESRFEVIRTGFVRPSGLQAVRTRMLAFVEEATGCDVEKGTVEGDAALLRGSLVC